MAAASCSVGHVMESVVLMSDSLSAAVATGVVLEVGVLEDYEMEIVRGAMFLEHDWCHRRGRYRCAGEV